MLWLSRRLKQAINWTGYYPVTVAPICAITGPSLLFTQTVAIATLFAPERRLRTRILRLLP